MDVTIVDCGIGNFRSVARMLEVVGGHCRIARTPSELTHATRVVIPGVGAFDAGMFLLKQEGWIEPLKRVANNGTPMLGICLGMQLFSKRSEEGILSGLGFVDADVVRMGSSSELPLKLPHMGWRDTKIVRDSALLPSNLEPQRFYYAHNYKVVCNNGEDVIATTVYGDEFTAAIQKGNIFGVQFHPEKSHGFGKALMKRFLEIEC